MSIIAWDGRTLAADRQATRQEMRRAGRKIWRLKNGELASINGIEAAGRELLKWYESGADPAKYPPLQATTDWAQMTIISPRGVFDYEQRPIPVEVTDKFMAWGSGRDYAL